MYNDIFHMKKKWRVFGEFYVAFLLNICYKKTRLKIRNIFTNSIKIFIVTNWKIVKHPQTIKIHYGLIEKTLIFTQKFFWEFKSGHFFCPFSDPRKNFRETNVYFYRYLIVAPQ